MSEDSLRTSNHTFTGMEDMFKLNKRYAEERNGSSNRRFDRSPDVAYAVADVFRKWPLYGTNDCKLIFLSEIEYAEIQK